MILDGEYIYLKSLQQSDFENFCRWYSDGQVTKFIGTTPLSRDKLKALFNQLLSDSKGVYFGIIKKDYERIIGYVFLAHISKSHRVCRE